MIREDYADTDSLLGGLGFSDDRHGKLPMRRIKSFPSGILVVRSGCFGEGLQVEIENEGDEGSICICCPENGEQLREAISVGERFLEETTRMQQR